MLSLKQEVLPYMGDDAASNLPFPAAADGKLADFWTK